MQTFDTDEFETDIIYNSWKYFTFVENSIKIFTELLHCPKNNLNHRMKTAPVTVGADPTVMCGFLGQIYVLYMYCMYYICTVYVNKSSSRDRLQIVCEFSDCFWDSVFVSVYISSKLE